MPAIEPEMSTIAARSVGPLGGFGLLTLPAMSVAIVRVDVAPPSVYVRFTGPLYEAGAVSVSRSSSVPPPTGVPSWSVRTKLVALNGASTRR